MTLIQKNIRILKPKKISTWRKISLGSWRPTGDSSILTQLELDAEPALELLSRINADRAVDKVRISFMHLFAKALGMAITKHPQINAIVRWGRIYPRISVDIFFHIANNFEDAEDLSGTVIRSIDEKNLDTIAAEIDNAVVQIRSGQDKNFAVLKSVFRLVPGFLSKIFIDLMSFIMYSLNIWSPLFGSSRDSFGSIMLSNVGSFGIDNAFAPIAPYTRIPMVVTLGAIRKHPFVMGDQVVVRKTVRIGFVFDHRICDGVQVQKMLLELERLLTIDKDFLLSPRAKRGTLVKKQVFKEKRGQ